MYLVDIGNSRIKGTEWTGHALKAVQVFDSVFELAKHINELNYAKVIFSSVRPALTDELEPFLKDKKLKYYRLTSRSPFQFTVRYKNPEGLGTDRLCGLEGALFLGVPKHSGPVITIDAGTATTVNILNCGRQFTGGIIMPGPGTMACSLNIAAEQLPLVNLNSQPALIGNSTMECIESGILNSTLSLIEKVISAVERDEKILSEVYVTGGFGEVISSLLTRPHIFNKELNLWGLASIAEKLIEEAFDI